MEALLLNHFMLLLLLLLQVINPLPSLDDSFDRPIAKALFDFEDEEEQDLLPFKQVHPMTLKFSVLKNLIGQLVDWKKREDSAENFAK